MPAQGWILFFILNFDILFLTDIFGINFDFLKNIALK